MYPKANEKKKAQILATNENQKGPNLRRAYVYVTIVQDEYLWWCSFWEREDRLRGGIDGAS
jgi:hypothetical protein